MTDIPEASDQQVTELDHLARAARSLQPGVLPDGLWEPVLALPTWWLIAEDTEGGISPMVSEVEGVGALFAFTTRRRAEAFIRDAELHQDPRDFRPTAAVPAYVVDRAEIYAHVGARIILFDCNDVGYFAPMAKLDDLWRRYHGAGVSETEDTIPEPRQPER